MNTKRYNGHASWRHWNVALWVNNDESLYRMARHYVNQCRTRTEAAQAMLQDLKSNITETPDGAKYNVPTLRAAMRDL